MNIVFYILGLSIPLLIIYWLVNDKLKSIVMIIGTIIFLWYMSPPSLLVLIITTLLIYFTLQQFNSNNKIIISLILSTAGILFFFKFNIKQAYISLGEQVLPFGLSYYSFRQIHYIFESYKKKLPKHDFLDFLSYLFFLPTLYIGPINRFQSFLKDNQRKRWDSQFFSYGLERILYGLFKVAFLGNYLISLKLSNYSENFIISYPWLYQYIQMVVFYLNAYFQFAGFSDIAIGLSALFGYRIMENFNYPFVASNIADFWKRWHISLSEWCNEYVFQPILSISRSFIISIFFSIIVLALWHEISYKYILWGVLHIIALNVWHFYNSTALYQLLNKYPTIQKIIGMFVTLHFVMISFMLIKTDDLTYFWNFIKILFLVN